MRLTDFTDYSLRVLIYAAVRSEHLVTIQEISETLGIARGHLVKIVHALGKAGYLDTVRGRTGGLRLGRPPAKITVGDVVRTMEPDFRMVECFDTEGNACVITAACGLRGVLGSALRAYFDVLDKFTLADLAAEQSTLERLLAAGPVVRPLVRIDRKRIA
ncbi:Rrf2 family transcriptional regulator [Trinickia caryophylli]|uniref:Transcriptional regulator, BadM/Rrf2 family n=1 Tax=Trinickia caryophylli TaxID=28094 RepID=A0A1X7FT60_TRICW|nr:Rrf2 family transcriptional regulator [Trinickia caryophylli]PMS11943.1 Rrf2 family transcriptional regulator [Trinickia caryophylli]TRX13979.1 Rrf2 family transcriptional regulator [Trinickia caryophylli]WQE15578.1 Rrf2 family transcriptional regulator [Trinickia caryophylli]SMF58093.1 transcriptional regulator, BadM/Rrf2 family [Trinickia caryophylli]GLU33666.1 DNA-binding protein [Trinickia caryophylli]